MKTLVVEDDFTSRLFLQEILKEYGPVHIAINGKEAVNAVEMALIEEGPYDLICLDILMPEMDGQEALQKIRELEKGRDISFSKGSKIIMTTALGDIGNLSSAFKSLCNDYLTKPIQANKLKEKLIELDLI